MNQFTRFIHEFGRDRSRGMSQAEFDNFHGVNSAAAAGVGSSRGKSAGEENQQQHDDPNAFGFENAQQELVYAHLEHYKQKMYCSAYATASSVLDLSKDILANDDENTRIVIARHMSIPFLSYEIC